MTLNLSSRHCKVALWACGRDLNDTYALRYDMIWVAPINMIDFLQLYLIAIRYLDCWLLDFRDIDARQDLK